MKTILLLLAGMSLVFSGHAQTLAKDNAQMVLDEALKNMVAKKPASATAKSAPAFAPASRGHANDVWDFMQIPATHEERVVPRHQLDPYGRDDIPYLVWTTKNHDAILAYQITKFDLGQRILAVGSDLYQSLALKGEVWTLTSGTHIFLERSFPDGTALVTWTDRKGTTRTTYVSQQDLKSW
jgi:hypothetical protein